MKLLAIDDEKLLLDDLVPQLKKQDNVESVIGFNSPIDALLFLKNNSVDAVFLDIVMPEMNGLVLAGKIKELRPDIKIVFLTAHRQYSINAFKVRASGYLLKPPSDEDIKEELKNILNNIVIQPKNKIVIQTFGNFEVFVDGKPVHFSRSKSKEILAYLVDRLGAGVTKKEIASIIWEDGKYSRNRQIQLETLVRELINSLKEVNAEEIVVRGRNSLSVNKAVFDCDYYRFCDWDLSAVNAYKGEYMANYSWAEFTAGYLDSKINK